MMINTSTNVCTGLQLKFSLSKYLILKIIKNTKCPIPSTDLFTLSILLIELLHEVFFVTQSRIEKKNVMQSKINKNKKNSFE